VALNCDNSMAAFDAIVPCGITDAGVTTLSLELGREVSVREVAPLMERHLRVLLSWQPFERSADLRRMSEDEAVPALSGETATPAGTTGLLGLR
jgi:lipoyl(octanoyl) transferase